MMTDVYTYRAHLFPIYPDAGIFGNSMAALQAVMDAVPAVLNHNVETIPRLYSEVRPQASYQRSLELLRRAKLFNSRILTKSGTKASTKILL